MTRSELVQVLAAKNPNLSIADIEAIVNIILDMMADTLVNGGRIEIRGFGSFCLRYRAPRKGRNPRTGKGVDLDSRFVASFKPGKELREQVDISSVTN